MQRLKFKEGSDTFMERLKHKEGSDLCTQRHTKHEKDMTCPVQILGFNKGGSPHTHTQAKASKMK